MSWNGSTAMDCALGEKGARSDSTVRSMLRHHA
jgi:hypothetical protein